MNIYAQPGHKVVLVSLTDGYESDRKRVAQLLTLGAVYTVQDTEIGNFDTEVFLREVPGQSFNSVFFEDLWDSESPLENPEKEIPLLAQLTQPQKEERLRLVTEARARTAISLRQQLGESLAIIELLKGEAALYGEFVSQINARTEERHRSDVAQLCQQDIRQWRANLTELRAAWTKTVPQFFDCYRHYKNGRLYRILHAAKDAGHDGRDVLVYEDIETNQCFVRDSEEFFASVEHRGKTVRRFQMEGPIQGKPSVAETGEMLNTRDLLMDALKAVGVEVNGADPAWIVNQLILNFEVEIKEALAKQRATP